MELENSLVQCINCGSPASMVLEDQEIISCIQKWIAPRLVLAKDTVCTACCSEVRAAANTLGEGDLNIVEKKCAICRISLPKKARSHQIIALRTDTEHYINTKTIILEKVKPLEVRSFHYICHPCWQRADRVAKPINIKPTSKSPPLHCANCHINVTRMKRHILNNENILMQVQQRVAPKVVRATDYICDACHTIFNADVIVMPENSADLVGHHKVCVKCGQSIEKKQQYHYVLAELNQDVSNILQVLILPRKIKLSDAVCHKCFVQVKRVVEDNKSDASDKVSQESDRITLPSYSRSPYTHSKCIFPACNSTFQQIVPLRIRVRLFSDHNFYIPQNCRICSYHLKNKKWTLLFESEIKMNSFTAAHIEDFCELLKNDHLTID